MIWTNVGLGDRRIYVSINLNELNIFIMSPSCILVKESSYLTGETRLPETNWICIEFSHDIFSQTRSAVQ